MNRDRRNEVKEPYFVTLFSKRARIFRSEAKWKGGSDGAICQTRAFRPRPECPGLAILRFDRANKDNPLGVENYFVPRGPISIFRSPRHSSIFRKYIFLPSFFGVPKTCSIYGGMRGVALNLPPKLVIPWAASNALDGIIWRTIYAPMNIRLQKFPLCNVHAPKVLTNSENRYHIAVRSDFLAWNSTRWVFSEATGNRIRKWEMKTSEILAILRTRSGAERKMLKEKWPPVGTPQRELLTTCNERELKRLDGKEN